MKNICSIKRCIKALSYQETFMNTTMKWNYSSITIISFLSLLVMMIGSQRLYAQGVGISESSITPDASSILELRSASRGFILPRLATGSISTPAFGMLIYNGTTTGNFLSFYNGSWITLAPLASPTFTGTVTIPSAFTLGSTSVTTTGTQLNYLNAVTGTTGTTSTNLVFSASPTFTGTVTHPTPFTLGATSVTTTGTQLNYLNAATGTTGTTSSSLVFSASPTFTGTVTIPSPFTLGVTSVTSTGTQLNYLNAATGTTGTTSTNIVFSTAPTLTGTTLAAGTLTVDPLTFTSGGQVLTTPVAGAMEYDGTAFYVTADATTGRSQESNQQIFRLTANGTPIGPGIADYFGVNSAIPTVLNGVYEITFYLYYLKTTAGTATYTITNTATYTNIVAEYIQSAVGGIATNAAQTGAGIVTTTAAAAVLPPTASLTNGANHKAVIRAIAECGTAGNIRLRITQSGAGTITPLRGSYFTVRRLFAGNVGTFVP
jgi:hypothetical protein